MGANRLTRVNELLRREIASALFRVLDPSSVDLAAITITRVETASNLRSAQVYVSVLGDEAKQQQSLRALLKRRVALQAEVASHVVLKYTPQYHFHLDHSIEDGDRVLGILAELESETPSPDDADPLPGDPTQP